MSGTTKSARPGAVAMGWWSQNIAPRENAAARGLSARLRRAAGPLAVLCEPQVHTLANDLGLGPGQAEKLVRLVCLLAEVREHNGKTLAQQLGGAEPVLSRSRFERLIRAEGDELTGLLRRAIIMAECRCNVASLAEDIIYWNDKTRNKWCFHYFGADAPRKEAPDHEHPGGTIE
ncbi:MAG: type I-E CRISPR-associated protein Cse2/CasB [Brevundimonas sp.]|jgi:CRISPR system Cascade subunit CasB|uniref:type I-E CRISPR-associated protein Cse2/CasB n=1 Tax=Brevundimonas sp. TaxID=1871086 RepID=UPI00391C6D57